MEQQIKITNQHDMAVIDIEGVIGLPEEWQFDEPQQRVATYERFRLSLQHIEEINAARVTVNIRSTGGDVNDALLIYDALQGLDAVITTRCWGYVASAATVIAQAASEGLREISANALYLIHDSSSAVEGNAAELERRIELLRKTDERLADLYSRRSGRDASLFAQLMAEGDGQGRWLNANETIEAGLADTIIEGEPTSTSEEPAVEAPQESLIEQLGITRAYRSLCDIIQRIGNNRSTTPVTTLPEQNPLPSNASSPTIKPALSLVAFEQLQQQLKATTLEPIEDPTLHEVVLSNNQRAYQDDARRMSRGY